MSEMSAEKKKEIEKYIIKSYFGGGKNVESFGGGVDVITGTDDGRIPHLIVEVTYFGGSGVVMINWDVYEEPHGTEWKNSFSMHICREREIERNRCDSVDSMMYAWEAWRAKIQGEPVLSKTNDEDLQKDKRIEELERTVKALKAEDEEYHNFLKALFPDEDIEKLVLMIRQVCGPVLSTRTQYWKDKCEQMQADNQHYRELAKQWEENYNLLLKKTGFDTVESLVLYLNDIHQLDTLLEVLANYGNKIEALQKEIGVYSRTLKEWKDSTGCPSPSAAKTLIECQTSWHHAYEDAKKKIESLEAALRESNSTMTKELEQEIGEWQKATERISPEEAKQYIERLKGRLNKIHDCAVDW